MGGTFRRSDRLLKSRDFRRVYDGSKALRKDFLALRAAPNGLAASRLGLSIGARRVRLAARRNRIKRFLREVYRNRKAGIKKGFDIIAAATKDPGKEVQYRVVEELFLELAKRAKILDEDSHNISDKNLS